MLYHRKKKFTQSLIALSFLASSSLLFAQHNQELRKPKTKEDIDILLNEAEASVSKNPLETINLAQVALKPSKTANYTLAYSKGLKLIGTAYFYLGKYDSTTHYWSASKNALTTIGGLPLADSYNNLGIIYQRTGDIDSSLYFHNKSLVIRTSNHDTLGIADSYFNMAAIFRIKGAYEQAIDLYFKSLKNYQALQLQDKESDVYNNIGLIYMAIKEYDQALNYFQKSLDIKLTSGDERKIASTLTNLATVNLQTGNYTEAERLFNESKSIFEKYNDIRNLAGISINLGVLYKENNDYEKAIENYLLAENQVNIIGDKESYGAVTSNLGALYYLMVDFKKAEFYYRKALNNAIELKSLPMQLNANLGLSKSLEKLGDYQNAMLHNLQYVEINDTLFKKSMGERIAELSEEYEAEKKARKIKELEAERLIIEKSNQFKKFVIWIIATCAVIAVLLLLFILNRIQLKRKLLGIEKEQYRLSNELIKKDLDQKNRELTSYAGMTLQKTKYLQDIRDELDKIDFNKSEPTLVIKKIKKEIDSTIDSSDEWEKFKIHFEGVHPNFFQSIQAQFSQLTANDLKYCAYIKLKMASKEIAVLMNISPNSAKMNKYRLKKKLNLSEDDSLDQFLDNF